MDIEKSDVLAALNGDVDVQKRLYEICQQSVTVLTYHYLRRMHLAGLKREDIHELLMTAFLQALSSYDDAKLPFIDYFKYKYIMQIRTEIRKNTAKQKHAVKADSTEDIDNDYVLQFQSPLYHEEAQKYSQFDKNEIYDLVVNQRVVKLTQKEYKIIKMYLEDYEVKAISKALDRNYTETFRSLKKAIDKIRDYFSNMN